MSDPHRDETITIKADHAAYALLAVLWIFALFIAPPGFVIITTILLGSTWLYLRRHPEAWLMRFLSWCGDKMAGPYG